MSRRRMSVDPGAVGGGVALDAEPLPIGAQIRDLRKARGMTINELAGKIGRSAGYVSQIERNISAVSIPTLNNISGALGVQITWFFQGNAVAPRHERMHIVRRGGRRKLTFTGAGTVEELLSPSLNGKFELILSRFESGYDSGESALKRDTEEAGLVLTGVFTLWINECRYVLESGDSFRIGREDNHRWANHGDEQVEVVWVISPPSY